ncbi:uncharacterized protein LOC111625086 [Centruroides sculpturatus]|uniref:uncharacterized protein LOC111625086 n=1 Tax=Centruroides sculpturatus TaxID=218467 RepID=UPI000C6EA348|nr:uncharacterized protein LOC111625086 [Centruroides sculpturatus]
MTNSPLARVLKITKATISTPISPRLFAFAKLHKDGKQLRPVVEKSRSPTILIERMLNSFATSTIEEYPCTVSNPVQLIHRLNALDSLDGVYFTVCDFESMFPSIRIEPCFSELRDFLIRNINDSSEHLSDILELAHLICHSSFFVFEGDTFLQSRGVPMGSPISGTLCELVVRRLEQQVLPGFKDDIILYARYVDDVFIVWKRKPDLAAFIETFNSNAYGLSLRAEQQSSTNVHFLDIDISLQQGRITTKVYRKSSYAPLFIHAQSHDPVSYKISAFKILVRRAFTHCSSAEDRKMELESISNVARLHGYPTRLIKALIARHQPKSTALQNNQSFVPITYNKILHSTYKQIARYAGKNIADHFLLFTKR